MATSNGWYPDPGGEPGRYRYWDGDGWSTWTSDDPRAAPPSGRTPASAARSTLRRGRLVLGLVAAALLVLTGYLTLTRAGRPVADGPDDRSPSSSGSGTTGTDQLPKSLGRPAPGSMICPFESGVGPVHHDGRVHGGRLSFPRVRSYPAPRPERSFTWWNGATSQTQVTEPGWTSIFAVGQVRTADSGFATPQQAAESSIACALNAGWYAFFTDRRDQQNEPTTIDGHAGWTISTEIRVDNPGLKVAGDRLTVIAVDDGRSNWLSVYCGMVPLGDTARLAVANRVRVGLRVG